MPVPTGLELGDGVLSYTPDPGDPTHANAVMQKKGKTYHVRVGVGADGKVTDFSWAPMHGAFETGQRATNRGLLRGATDVLHGPTWFIPQWIGEKSVEYGGRLLDAAAHYGGGGDRFARLAGDTVVPRPIKGAFGAFTSGMLEHAATEKEHDRRQRKRISESLQQAGFDGAAIPRAMGGGSEDARRLTRGPEIEALRERGAGKEEIAHALRARGYSETSEGYRPGEFTFAGTFFDPRRPLRSFEAAGERVMDAADAMGMYRGSLDRLSHRDIMGVAAAESTAEIFGGAGIFGAASKAFKAGKQGGAVREFVRDFREVARQQGTVKPWKWKKPTAPAAGAATVTPPKADPIKKAIEEGEAIYKKVLKEGPGASQKVMSGVGTAVVGAGTPLVVATGAYTTPTVDEQNRPKTNEQIYDDARFRGVIAEVFRAGGMAGLKKLTPAFKKYLAARAVRGIEEAAAQGDTNAKAWLRDRAKLESMTEWLTDHGTDKMVADFEGAQRAADRQGLPLRIMTLLGRTGETIAEGIQRYNPATSRNRLKASIMRDERLIEGAKEKVLAHSATRADGGVDEQLTGAVPDMTGRPHEFGARRPDYGEEVKAYEDLSAATRTEYGSRMKALSETYNKLNKEGQSVKIDMTGLNTDNIVRNALTEAESVYTMIDRDLLKSVRAIAARFTGNEGYQMTVTDAHELIRLNNSIARSYGKDVAGAYNPRSANRELMSRIRKAAPALADQYANLNRTYADQIASTFRGSMNVGTRGPQKVATDRQYEWYRVKKDLFGGSPDRINEATFFDYEKTGKLDALSNAVVKTVRTNVIDEAGNVDFKKLHSFLEKNRGVLNQGSGAGKKIVDSLVREVDGALARALGRNQGRTIDDSVIDTAIADPARMRHLMNIASKGEKTGIHTLRWAVTQKLLKTDAPADELAKNRQSYEELFGHDPQHLQDIRDVADLTQRINGFLDMREKLLGSVKALRIGENSLWARVQTDVMAELNTSIETLAANVKMIRGIRTQGSVYGAAHLGSLYFGAHELKHVLNLMLEGTDTAQGARKMGMMLKPLDPNKVNRRFANSIYQYFKPYFYKYEQEERPESQQEKVADQIDISAMRQRLGQ